MNKTNIFIVTTIVFLLFDILLLFQIKKYKTVNQHQQLIQDKTTLLSSMKDLKVNMLEDAITQSLTSEDLTIRNNITIDNGEASTLLNNVVGSKPRLILRYSELNCQACIDVQLASLNKLAYKIGKENIIILASYKAIANMTKFKRINKLDMSIYNVDSIGLPLEKENIPFYFIIDQNKKTKLTFVPYKEFPSLTEKYFELIQNRFFSENPK
ncbi:MAG TPA: hypothetical protein DIW31_08520 [Bacteroidales bacterium]|nr:hypothetical protein [Bacteroidales bacterium]